MKTLLSLVLLSILAFTVSCSSAKVNDAKIAAANKAQTVVTNELKVQYADITVAGVDCNAEADAIGLVVHDKVFDLLKAKETLVQANMMVDSSVRSPAGTAVYEVCTFLVSSVIPGMIKDMDAKYSCLRALGADHMSKASSDICGIIKF